MAADIGGRLSELVAANPSRCRGRSAAGIGRLSTTSSYGFVTFSLIKSLGLALVGTVQVCRGGMSVPLFG